MSQPDTQADNTDRLRDKLKQQIYPFLKVAASTDGDVIALIPVLNDLANFIQQDRERVQLEVKLDITLAMYDSMHDLGEDEIATYIKSHIDELKAQLSQSIEKEETL
jgi:hypothetical protein